MTKRSRPFAASLAAVLLAVAGCSAGGPTPAPDDATAPAPVGFEDLPSEDPVPDDLAYVSESSVVGDVVIASSEPVSVHSAPDVVYTRIGEIAPGTEVTLTGVREGTVGSLWAEIAWQGDTTAWIPVESLGP